MHLRFGSANLSQNMEIFVLNRVRPLYMSMAHIIKLVFRVDIHMTYPIIIDVEALYYILYL